MTDIRHVHEGTFKLKNIFVPFVVSQTSDNVLAIEIGLGEEKFTELEIAISDSGEIVFYGKAQGIPSVHRVGFGNILKGQSVINTGAKK